MTPVVPPSYSRLFISQPGLPVFNSSAFKDPKHHAQNLRVGKTLGCHESLHLAEGSFLRVHEFCLDVSPPWHRIPEL